MRSTTTGLEGIFPLITAFWDIALLDFEANRSLGDCWAWSSSEEGAACEDGLLLACPALKAPV